MTCANVLESQIKLLLCEESKAGSGTALCLTMHVKAQYLLHIQHLHFMVVGKEEVIAGMWFELLH